MQAPNFDIKPVFPFIIDMHIDKIICLPVLWIGENYKFLNVRHYLNHSATFFVIQIFKNCCLVFASVRHSRPLTSCRRMLTLL